MLSYSFIGITLLSLLLFYYGTGKNSKVLLLGFLWILLVGLVSYNGYFTNTSEMPPRFLFIMAGAIVASVLMYKLAIRSNINSNFLLGVHTLRFPIEIGLYQLFLQKTVPVLMTYKGWNFDIVIGVSAILILLYILVTKKVPPRKFMFTWNILGLVFLATIVTIAILSAPLPIQQLAFNQPNIAVLKFPFIYLPTFIVPIVFLSHILAIKKPLSTKEVFK